MGEGIKGKHPDAEGSLNIFLLTAWTRFWLFKSRRKWFSVLALGAQGPNPSAVQSKAFFSIAWPGRQQGWWGKLTVAQREWPCLQGPPGGAPRLLILGKGRAESTDFSNFSSYAQGNEDETRIHGEPRKADMDGHKVHRTCHSRVAPRSLQTDPIWAPQPVAPAHRGRATFTFPTSKRAEFCWVTHLAVCAFEMPKVCTGRLGLIM